MVGPVLSSYFVVGSIRLIAVFSERLLSDSVAVFVKQIHQIVDKLCRILLSKAREALDATAECLLEGVRCHFGRATVRPHITKESGIGTGQFSTEAQWIVLIQIVFVITVQEVLGKFVCVR